MKKICMCAALACSLLALVLVGCSGSGSGGSGASGSGKADPDSLLGVWATDTDSTLGFDAYLELDEDGYAAYIVGENWYDATWSLENGKGQLLIAQYAMDDYAIELEDGSETGGSSEAASSSSASAASSEAADAGENAEENAEDEFVAVEVKPVALTYSDGKITIGSNEGSKLVFAKTDAESVWSFFGMDEGNGIQAVEVVEEDIKDISPVTIADESGYSIIVTGKGTDFTADPGYRLSLTNKGDKAIYVTNGDDFKVAGKDIAPGFGETISPGETLDTFMYFDKTELGGSVEALVDVTGSILVLDDESGDELATVAFKMD